MGRFIVEFNFEETERGAIAMSMKEFIRRWEAEKFAETVGDARIIECTAAYRFDEQGRKIQLW